MVDGGTMGQWDSGTGAKSVERRAQRLGGEPTLRSALFFTFHLSLFTCPLLTIPTYAFAQTDEVGLPLGTVPEPTVIEDLEGNEVDLSRWIGKQPVLFQFWALWCEQCKALEPKLTAAYEKFSDEVAFVAISVAINQTKRSILRHLEKSPIPHVVLWDTRGRAVRAFMAPTTSYVVVLDADGKVAYTGVGPDQDIEMAVRRVTKK